MAADISGVALEIREAFRVLDRDGNGFISKQELGMAMRSLGYMPSEVELAIIMQRLDMDDLKGTLLTSKLEAERNRGNEFTKTPQTGTLSSCVD
ncbi:hypothetical protein P7K49_004257 [Saguinus oedipus]|uniref:EF-hand domain-containing protein n=1 Tax=Saguinus oedipus TaxID=9490 RepID=A0ABQ9W6V8_SAGOE|nr:hypothetical protein P7K49_004257 [Saguinus oedipus]